ncbi:M42 family metallopeptidase [Mycoplasma zalophidermidis]|uniref:M42 family metallopeptidase n=1 Tax=Mycoplasma zalophidermidis TaxID=398174 RepID=A0ABS6DQT5_9MOLU|nr:M42 family metallopeptidase [Mycoplasma zalophidermidis]MBU4690037.1 M42 family metallopeptidase [Mycoplasma zalophidermidis]MBU4693291.1 M42 family metallopeptidase [Mycoplasma zalophidermidis]MCR8966413.1 M42 family metallopeptidase [Mycoplasma zalophidermidis]
MSKYTKLATRLKEYMEIEAMSRYEEPVAQALKNNTQSNNLEYTRDGFGSLIISNKQTDPNAPVIMIAAHMDEVGYFVRSIEENGNMLVSPVGGIWPATVIGTKCKLVTNKDNKIIYGVFGHTSIHILESEKISKVPTNKELYIDCGFNSKQEALDFGIEAGDRVYMSGEAIDMPNNLIAGKAMDNRAGVTVIDFLANNIKDLKLPNKTYIVGTVQEEVGLRGAKTATSIIDADVAIAIDTCASHDTTGCIKGGTKLGDGVALLVKDGGLLTNPKLTEMLMSLARKHNIPAYKYISEGGGNDATSLQYGKGGVPAITFSLPQRYLHSPIGVCSLVDIQAAIDLATEFVKTFNAEKAKELKHQ